jgi:hypothetical protein
MLASAARAVNLPYPVVLVLGGIVLGVVPGLPEARLDPQLVLVIFLPPPIYVIAEVRRRLDDPLVETTSSLLSGYPAYVPAEQLGVSGILAALTVVYLIRRSTGGRGEKEELKARRVVTKAALSRIDELGAADWTRDDSVERMRGLYEYRRRRLAAPAGKLDDAATRTAPSPTRRSSARSSRRSGPRCSGCAPTARSPPRSCAGSSASSTSRISAWRSSRRPIDTAAIC